MLLELEFNQSVTGKMTDGTSSWQENIGCSLHEQEYLRAVKEGSLLLLPDSTRKVINTAYSRVGQINTFVRMYSNTEPEGSAFAEATNRLLVAFRIGNSEITLAFTYLKSLLKPEGGDSHE